MTTQRKAVRRKLSLLELAKQMNNVSKACQIMGYSRQQFYEIRRNFQTFGADGLIDSLPGAKGVNDLVILHQKRSFESASLLVFSK